jgi:hypothetical protein
VTWGDFLTYPKMNYRGALFQSPRRLVSKVAWEYEIQYPRWAHPKVSRLGDSFRERGPRHRALSGRPLCVCSVSGRHIYRSVFLPRLGVSRHLWLRALVWTSKQRYQRPRPVSSSISLLLPTEYARFFPPLFLRRELFHVCGLGAAVIDACLLYLASSRHQTFTFQAICIQDVQKSCCG